MREKEWKQEIQNKYSFLINTYPTITFLTEMRLSSSGFILFFCNFLQKVTFSSKKKNSRQTYETPSFLFLEERFLGCRERSVSLGTLGHNFKKRKRQES